MKYAIVFCLTFMVLVVSGAEEPKEINPVKDTQILPVENKANEEQIRDKRFIIVKKYGGYGGYGGRSYYGGYYPYYKPYYGGYRSARSYSYGYDYPTYYQSPRYYGGWVGGYHGGAVGYYGGGGWW